ncbi:MAG: hypothetical protein RI897_637 [Verrucomicrobiota bacterium]
MVLQADGSVPLPVRGGCMVLEAHGGVERRKQCASACAGSCGRKRWGYGGVIA